MRAECGCGVLSLLMLNEKGLLRNEGESVRLDPEVYNSVDAIVCAQLCEMDEKWQDWVASKWLDRTYSTVPKVDES